MLMMEARIQETLSYLDDHPDAKVAGTAREFDVSRSTLGHRLDAPGQEKDAEDPTIN